MKFVIRPVIAAASIVAAAGILAAGAALKPALANGGFVSPDTSCNSTNPCVTDKNKGLGPGLSSINTNSSPFGAGLIGQSTKGAAGVRGLSVGGDGVDGESTNWVGTNGTGGTWGVFGYSLGGDGVEGQSRDSFGVVGFSSNFVGIEGASSSSAGVWGISESSAPAIIASGSTGDGIDVDTDGGVGALVQNINGNGTDMRGTYIGAIGRAPDCGSGAGFPFVGTDQNGNNLFWVDCTGTVFAHSYGTFLRIHNGNVATSFTPQSTTATIEDNGTGHLVNGMATVALNSTFAHTIDSRSAYQVMLTPDGDTRGLYVAAKTPNGFVVREVQGGRGSLDFDYHIYAVANGQAGQHMTEMTRSQMAQVVPHAPAVAHHFAKPALPKTLHPK